MTSLVELVRHALRRLRRSPGYSFPVIISLALGIGLNTAVFSVMEDVVRRPLPYPDDRQLAVLEYRSTQPKSGDSASGATGFVFIRDLIVWRQRSRTIQAFGVMAPRRALVAGPASAEYLNGGTAADDLLSALQVRPVHGRWFTADDISSRARVVVIGDALWRRQFAEKPDAVGQVLRIEHEPWTIIGVMPPGVALPEDAEFWTPHVQHPLNPGVQVIARYRSGVGPAQVGQELSALAPTVTDARARKSDAEILAIPLREYLFGSPRPILRLLTGAAALLLLIGCANIANLSLARTLERQRELAVRLTLGASKRSLVSLVLVENLLLALGGAAIGVVIALWGTRVVVSLGPQDIARVDAGVGFAAVAFAAAVGIVAAILVSIAPVLAATDRGVQPLLTQVGARIARGRSSRRARYALVATQLAVALLLITGAGLLIRSVQRLIRPDRLGFSPNGVVIATVPVWGGTYRDPAQRQRLIEELRRRIQAFPGVISTGLGPPPLVDVAFLGMLWHTDTVGGSRRRTEAFIKPIDPGYIGTHGIRLIEGRNFLPSDDANAAQVALLSLKAARLFFPNGNAVGRELNLRALSYFGMTRPRVVGIIDDVLQRDLTVDAKPDVLIPVAQQPAFSWPALAVRSSGPPEPLIAALRAALKDVDPEIAPSRLETMDAVVAASLRRHSFLLLLLGVFAALGLSISAIGLYAVISYLVTQRTLEIGIRMALGAQRRDVFALVLREGALLAVIGLAIGIPAALALSRILTSFLFEIQPHDLTTFAAAPLGLALVAMCATFLPARRAAAVDPARAMRAE